ncbi:phosphatidylinositol-specific phospholipase C1-like protein [Novosphingobium beihaiensis]|uniref:Phosphatidylinositol-specific phospholipase C1-like protein n=1 Tax=Novosphingobium beihaiensis TaxID=2930389 RepID=A0ABT0BTL8_9SPHN|nr:phosphatidylinositol-specific phospholipase C1-like protein [Novosphingobium beihaiensis]MCJ2188404.1 phosphatidylinositol-specific phospholipase C1-like protein [Novosphingobium beihaiensis]
MNDIQAVGTHNSYKQAMSEEVRRKIAAKSAKAVLALDYSHRPLAEQLDHGARQLEIDVNYDPEGGYYAGNSDDAELRKPGFKVLHIAFSDAASSCERLVTCLTQIRDWSRAHPHHAPILLMFNTKETGDEAHGKPAKRFTEAAFDALDAEIRSVIPRGMLILPDDVQGGYPTLREAVLAGNWPTLDAARGKVFFALDEHEDKVAIYRGKRKSLEGRVFFVNTREDSPAAAYLTLNDPIAQAERIKRDVKAGFIVRTRADADTWEARAGNLTRLRAALASGAQYISTDYLWEDPRLPGYRVALPGGGPVRCNPVRCPGGAEPKE